MIHFICGKPRAGKSYWATSEVIRWLADSKLGICTNLPLRMPELNTYTQNKYGRSLDVVRRVHLLDGKDLGDFWRWRYVDNKWYQAPAVGKDEETKWGDKQGDGVVYFLDEIHHIFGSREWAATGKRVLWYHSQHGKLGDHVYLITQRASLVDKQLRELAEDFMVLRNRSRERVGIFRNIPRITYGCYLRCPTGSVQDVQEFGGWTKLDPQIAGCYDTASGIGIQGTVADMNDKRKGLSLWWLIPGFVVLVLLLSFGPQAAIKGIAGMVAGPKEKEVQAPMQQAPKVQPMLPPAPAPVPAPAPAPAPVEDTTPKVEGWAVSGASARLLLSSGSIRLVSPVAAGDDYLIFRGRSIRVGDKWEH